MSSVVRGNPSFINDCYTTLCLILGFSCLCCGTMWGVVVQCEVFALWYNVGCCLCCNVECCGAK